MLNIAAVNEGTTVQRTQRRGWFALPRELRRGPVCYCEDCIKRQPERRAELVRRRAELRASLGMAERMLGGAV